MGYSSFCSFVRELRCHKAQAHPLGPCAGLCAGCGKFDWAQALQLADDGVITKHPACEVASQVKWKQPPVIQQTRLPQVGDKVKAEYKGAGIRVVVRLL